MLPHKIVTLPNATERQAFVKDYAAQFHFTPCFHYGINGSQMSPQERQQAVIEPDILTVGEVGCALSHLQIYREMVEQDIPYLLILEDDVALTPEFFDYLPMFEHFIHKHMCGKAAVLHLHRQHEFIRLIERWNNRITVHSTQYALGAPAYIITKEAAQAVLQIQTPLRWVNDFWKFYYYLGILKLYSTNTSWITFPDQFDSTIDSMGARKYTPELKSQRRMRFYKTMWNDTKRWKNIFFFLFCFLRKAFLRIYTDFNPAPQK